MDEKLLKWLYDIKLAIEEIDSFFEEHPNDYTEYQNEQSREIWKSSVKLLTE